MAISHISTNKKEILVAEIPFLDLKTEPCSPDLCPSYGTNWVCPPACPSLVDQRKFLNRYRKSLVIKNDYKNIDSKSYADYKEFILDHNQKLMEIYNEISGKNLNAYLLTAGGCNICEDSGLKCTYPNQQCRNYGQKKGSISSFGIDCSKLCKKLGFSFRFNSTTLNLLGIILF